MEGVKGSVWKKKKNRTLIALIFNKYHSKASKYFFVFVPRHFFLTKTIFPLFQIIAKKNGLKWETVKRLGELQDALGLGLDGMISVVNQILHTEPYTKEEIVAELETTSQHLDEISLTSNTKHIREFKLRARALHVFQGKSAYVSRKKQFSFGIVMESYQFKT